MSTLVVTNLGDSGSGSLRETIAGSATGDTITFDQSLLGGTLVLTTGELGLTHNLTINGDINGDGVPDITIDAAAHSRVFNVDAVTATLDGLVITGGNSIYGAGIVTAAGTDLTVHNSTITNNHVGGGIRNVGTLTLDHVTLSGNTSDADGGGIANALTSAVLHVVDSTIANNTAAFNGGGLVNPGGGNSATLTNVTMFGNSAGGGYGGGAIYSGGELTLTQVTITGNHADSAGSTGGGILAGAGSATIANSIIAGNHAGSGADDVSALTLINYTGVSVVGTGSDADASDHLIQTPTLGDLFAQVTSVDPDNNPATSNSFQAGAPADNGGPVKTVAINPTGIARDAGGDAAAVYNDDNNPVTPDVPIPTDARGFARVVGAHVDIGAFEQQAGQSFVVTTLADELDSTDPHATLADFGGTLSLREALVLTQQDPASIDTITFDPTLMGGNTAGVNDGHLILTQGELGISSNVIVDGSVNGGHAPGITIDANGVNSTRVLDVSADIATLDGLVITGGNSIYGAGVVTSPNTNLTITNSVITNNHVGGGIRNVGTLTLDHVTLSGNTSDADGGGIANTLTGAVLHVVDSTIANNTAAFNGGGLVNSGGNSATLTNVTMFGNSAGGSYGGGAIYSGGDLALTQVTITGNHADGAGSTGGGILAGAGSATIANSIIAGNHAGSGADDVSALTLINYTGVSVVGTGSDADASDHLIQTPTLGDLFAQVTSIDPDNDPGTDNSFQAGQLANNGGPIATVAINVTSVASDAGNDAAAVYDDDNNPATPDIAITTDARGFDRIKGAHVDIGAFEVQQAPPTDIDLSHASAPENSATGTVIGSLSDTDPDVGDTASFSLTDNAGGRFAISGANLVVANGTLLDYEQSTSHSVTIRATDSDGLTFDKVFTVGITNVNEAPADIALSHTTVAENSTNGTVVGSLSDTDPDAGDTASFALTDNAGGRFAISGGNLVVADGALLDYEQSTSHSVAIQVTDSGGLTFDKVFTIGITNVNEAPTEIALSHATVAENSTNGTVVGSLSDTDPDAGDTASFALTDNAGGRFAISGSNLVVADGALLDYEQGTSHSVTIRATDSAGLAFDEVFAIGVTNVNEAPVITSDGGHATARATTPENTLPVTTVHATDPDGDAVTYAIAGGDDGSDFQIDPATGALRFILAPNFDYPSDGNGDNHYVVQVSASDGTLSATQTITVEATAVPNLHQPSPADFNHDGTTDIFYVNDNGSTWLSQIDGLAPGAGSGFGPTLASGQHVVGIGDFDGDGKADLLIGADDGSIVFDRMDGASLVSSTPMTTLSPGWHVEDVADFNGDGKADILFQNDGTGALWTSTMNGATITGGGTPGALANGYHIAAVADFDADGKSDILFENASGQLWLNEMDGATVKAPGPVTFLQPGWHVAAAADFDGDGMADLLFRNDDGRLWMSEMDSFVIKSGTPVAMTTPDWHIDGTGDYNGDGKADILWQNDSGALWISQMNGPQITDGHAPGAIDPSWHIASVHTYDLV